MHPLELRRAAMAMLAVGWSVNATSNQLGISRAAIRDWRDHGAERLRVLDRPGELPPAEYSTLFGYYLGDGCISVTTRTTALRVSCDRTYPGIIDDLELCIRAVHPHMAIHRVNAPGVVVVQNAVAGGVGQLPGPCEPAGRRGDQQPS
jgi:hypothetical protein